MTTSTTPTRSSLPRWRAAWPPCAGDPPWWRMAAAITATRRWHPSCCSAMRTAATTTTRSRRPRRAPAAQDERHAAIAGRAGRRQPSRARAPQPPHRPPMRRLFHVPTIGLAMEARKSTFSARRAQLSPLHTCPLYRDLLTQICAMARGAGGLARRGEEGACDLTHFERFFVRLMHWRGKCSFYALVGCIEAPRPMLIRRWPAVRQPSALPRHGSIPCSRDAIRTGPHRAWRCAQCAEPRRSSALDQVSGVRRRR